MDPNDLFDVDMPDTYSARYFPRGGDPVSTVLMIDREVTRFPGVFDSAVPDNQVEIVLRYDHILHANKGDRITVGNETFTVESVIEDDHFGIRVAVK